VEAGGGGGRGGRGGGGGGGYTLKNSKLVCWIKVDIMFVFAFTSTLVGVAGQRIADFKLSTYLLCIL